MGFWHTGYLERCEPAGLDEDLLARLAAPAPRFACGACLAAFVTRGELQRHIFEEHPLRRPVMRIRGREAGREELLLTRPLEPEDVLPEPSCRRAWLNGRRTAAGDVPAALAEISRTRTVCDVRLEGGGGVTASCRLVFRIAGEEDLAGVEHALDALIRGMRLDAGALDGFVLRCERHGSARHYCDGIHGYLVGIMAKERRPDCGISHEDHERKLNAAGAALSAYDRPAARLIRGLIHLNLNHFAEAARCGGELRPGHAAARLRDAEAAPFRGEKSFDAFLTDGDTERIIRWACAGPEDLVAARGDMEAFLARGSGAPVTGYDAVKARILLAKAALLAGDRAGCAKQVRELRSLPGLKDVVDTLNQACGMPR